MIDSKWHGMHMRQARIDAGMTLQELSSKAGIVHSTVSSLETGKRNPSLATVMLLANALGLSIDEYVGHEPKGERDD